MFSTKLEVDRHVKETFNKLNSDGERDTRCYTLAKLYYKVKDYESAIKYVNRYIINVRNTAQAQRFLGECYEAIKQPSKALDAYKTSLELEGGQRDLVLKVCELLSDPELPLVTSVASYWLERLTGLLPKHPIVFKLREKLVRANPDTSKDPRELESLILAEIMARPNVPEVRIRFMEFLLDTKNMAAAIKQEAELISINLFPEHLPWFECLHRVNQAYEKAAKDELTMDYYLMKLTVLDRRCYLTLQDFGPDKRSNIECAAAIFGFDQSLNEVSKFKPKPADKIFFDAVLGHFRGQLASHMAVYKLRRAKSEPGTWQRAVKVAGPLLTIATKRTHLTERQETKLMAQWRIQDAERVAVAAHVLRSWADGNSRFLEEIYKQCGGKWRDRIYENIYHNKEHIDASETSDFLNHSSYLDLPTTLPLAEDLAVIEKDAQFAHPTSLHHMVWLGLANSVSLGHIKSSFRCHLFPNLPLTTTNIENSSPDTINRLDVDTFLYSAVFCAKKEEEIRPGNERPKLLPVALVEELSNHHQAEWWSLVNKLCSKASATLSCDQRLRLRKGVETVRALGSHGLHAKLLYHVAQQFRLLSEEFDDAELNTAFSERAEVLWKAALPLLERLKKRQPVREVGSKLFDYGGSDWSIKDVENALEEGKTFLAVRLLKAKNYEDALEMLLELTNPEALFYQAVIYKTLAEEAGNTGEISSYDQQKGEVARLLMKAKKVLDAANVACRSRRPQHVHNLNKLIESTGDEIETLLSQCDPDSNVTAPVFDTKLNKRVQNVAQQSVFHYSTPKLVRSPVTVENLHQSFNHTFNGRSNDGNNDAVTEELKLLRSDMGDVKSLIQEILAELKKVSFKLVERQEMEDLLNAEEFAAEEAYDEAAQTYYNIPEVAAPRTMPPMQQFPFQAQFGSLQQFLPGMIWPGSLPFSEGQQLPDFRALHNGPPVGMHPSLPPVIPAAAPTELPPKMAPNVVVTSSATLPTYTRVPQPPMAVTIPPEHIRGGVKPQDVLSNSHAFQIPVANSLHASSPATVESPSDKYQARAYEQTLQGLQATPKSALNSSATGSFKTPESSVQTPAKSQGKEGLLFESGADLCLNYDKPSPDWIMGKLTIRGDLKAARILIVRRTDGKSVVDQSISSSTNLARLSDNIISWSAADYGYGDSVVQKFVVRFTVKPVSDEFEATVKRCLEQFPAKKVETTPTSTPTAARQKQTVVAPPIFTFSPKTPTTTTPSLLTIKDGLQSTEKTIFGTNVSPGFNFSSLAQSGQVAPVFAQSPEFKGFAGMGQQLFANNKTGSKENKAADHDASGEEEKEYEPNVEFAPVIPLPDLVEIKTGEEDEEKVYEERAKILKFNAETKEWKEKGRGNVKLLRHPESGKVRIVMRRDQVHKVCCNHYLDENMKFQPMSSSNRAATWSAQDFSSGELSPELLAIQFTKPEILKEFLTKVEELQQQLRDGTPKKQPAAEKNAGKTTEPLKPLSEMFKKAPGSWECSLCLVSNKPDVYKCIACETKRPGDFGDVAAAKTPEKSTPAPTFTFGIPPPAAEETKSAPFLFGNTATPAFTFGSSPAQTFSFGVAASPGKETEPGFKLGSAETFSFKFNKSFNDSVPKSSGRDDDNSSEDEEYVESEDDNLTFKPVIPLPDKVPLHTGEEDEDVVYSHRAKLYRFSDKEWKERGLGDIKILKHKETSKVRLLMRREQVLKICLNHYLSKDMQFQRKDPKSWTWSAADFAEGTVSQDLFCIRFRDETIAGEFKAAIDKEQANLVASPKAPQVEKSDGNREATSASRALFDVQLVYEAAASAEDQATAQRLQLPVNFFRYKEAKPCSGCIGCEKDDEEENAPVTAKTVEEKEKTPDKTKTTPENKKKEETPLRLIPKPETVLNQVKIEETPKKVDSEDKPKSSVFTNFSFSSALSADSSSPKLDAVEKPAGSVFSSFNFNTALDKNAPPTTLFGSASGNIFGNKAPIAEFTKTPVFGGTALATPSTTPIFSGSKSLNDPTKPAFNADSSLSFANLSKNQSPFVTSNAPTWDTTVKPIFTTMQAKKNEPRSDNESGESDNENADDSYDPQYKPIIAMPDAIEVKTGEEDEEKLFCERAKLYRFDTTSKEWKERGIGEMKILTNEKNGTYRILMRREHVHNTICNMRITPGLELRPMNKAQNAWVWYGMNFIDGCSENEQLSVRFKTEEIANRFKDAIESCESQLANASRELTGDEYYSGEGRSDTDDGEEEEYEEETTWIKNDVRVSVDGKGSETEELVSYAKLRISEVNDGEFFLFRFGDDYSSSFAIQSDPDKDDYVIASDVRLLIESAVDGVTYNVDFSEKQDLEDVYEYLRAIKDLRRENQ